MSGSQILGKFIEDSAITTPKIANTAVDASKIATDAVTNPKIQNSAVDANKLATDAVTTPKILADAVTDTKVRLSNNAYLRARNAANSADIDTMKVNASDVIEFASFPQKSGTPSNANDLANKAYVDAQVGGGTASAIAKMAVHFVYDGGSAPTGVGSGSSYDGYTASTGDRFLYIGSSNSNQDRGIYVVTGVGTSTRATDADVASEFAFGQRVPVKFGDVYGGADYVLMTSAAITLGTTVLDYRRLNQRYNQEITLVSGDITNQYVDLAFVAQPNTVELFIGGSRQWEGGSLPEFSMSVVGGVSRLTFLNNIATGGPSALVAGNILRISFIKASY